MLVWREASAMSSLTETLPKLLCSPLQKPPPRRRNVGSRLRTPSETVVAATSVGRAILARDLHDAR